jgi:hypothetical protein
MLQLNLPAESDVWGWSAVTCTGSKADFGAQFLGFMRGLVPTLSAVRGSLQAVENIFVSKL